MSTITSTSESKNYFAMQTFFGSVKEPAYATSFADATASQEGYGAAGAALRRSESFQGSSPGPDTFDQGFLCFITRGRKDAFEVVT
jgi:hypothetical protein